MEGNVTLDLMVLGIPRPRVLDENSPESCGCSPVSCLQTTPRSGVVGCSLGAANRAWSNSQGCCETGHRSPGLDAESPGIQHALLGLKYCSSTQRPPFVCSSSPCAVAKPPLKKGFFQRFSSAGPPHQKGKGRKKCPPTSSSTIFQCSVHAGALGEKGCHFQRISMSNA